MAAVTEDITSHLLSSQQAAYDNATQAPFLRLAGEGRLPLEILSQWLSQDRLYAQAYVRFIGGLISMVHLPIPPNRDTSDDKEDSGQAAASATLIEGAEFRVLKVLSSALAGIVQEIEFFETTAAKYGIDLSTTAGTAVDKAPFGPNEVTQRYIDLFDSFHRPNSVNIKERSPRNFPRSLLSGLVLLWATEKCYLEAWAYAESQAPPQRSTESDLDGGALRKEFIPNWTSKEFRSFVDDIGRILNQEVTRAARAQGTGGQEEVRRLAEKVWEEVLNLEVGFWPTVKEA